MHVPFQFIEILIATTINTFLFWIYIKNKIKSHHFKSKATNDPPRPLPVHILACVCACEFRQDCMGNEAASVVILYCDETPIKDDYDVDKVTQQIALIQPLQESTVLNGAGENMFIGEVFWWSWFKMPHTNNWLTDRSTSPNSRKERADHPGGTSVDSRHRCARDR